MKNRLVNYRNINLMNCWRRSTWLCRTILIFPTLAIPIVCIRFGGRRSASDIYNQCWFMFYNSIWSWGGIGQAEGIDYAEVLVMQKYWSCRSIDHAEGIYMW